MWYVVYVCGVCMVCDMCVMCGMCGVWCVEGKPARFFSSSQEEAELEKGSESREGERRLRTQNYLSQ